MMDLSDFTTTLGGREFRVYAATDSRYRGSMIVLHGLSRNPESYRQSALPLAEKMMLNVYCPYFPENEFSNDEYNRPTTEGGTRYVTDLADKIRQGKSSVYLYGHSAGGQHACRVAAYNPRARMFRRIVIANPSTWVWPDLHQEPPYGFDYVRDAERRLRAYLGLRISVYYGADDTGTEDLSMGPPALMQGDNRRARAENVFVAARTEARLRNIECPWRLYKAAGIGHTHGGMIRAPEAEGAFRGVA